MIRKNVFVSVLCAGVFGLSACAEHPNRVEAAYIPGIIYKGATCNELATERHRLAHYVGRVAQSQRITASGDTAAVSAGVLISPLFLLALPETVDKSAQLAVARGHYRAIEQASLSAGCGTMADYRNYRYEMGIGRQPGQFPPL